MIRNRPLIMVVEDDPEMNRLECELLELGGLATVPAYTGTEALEVASRQETDGVLLDVMLPEMDGFETCRQLRSRGQSSQGSQGSREGSREGSEKGSRLPIVLVTALDSTDCRRRGEECGADAYFSKPFDPDGVVAALQALIRSRVPPCPAYQP